MTEPALSRRDVLRAGALAVGASLAGTTLAASGNTSNVLETRVITHQPHLYHGWPTLTRQKSGRLLLVWSGRREAHVCPFGTVEMMTSDDEGATWTWPRTLLDSALDDRDAGILETQSGTLLVTTFTSLAYEPILERAEREQSWDEDRLARWQAARDRLSAKQRKQELGTWMLRSTDNGLTWSARYDSLVNSPHGPTQLADGRILYAGKQLWRDTPRIGVSVSDDDGQSWNWLAEIPTRPGDDPNQYHELHAVETAGGRIIAQIRNHNKQTHYETLQTHSDDGGTTWSVPETTGVWGYPTHLLRLRDDRIVMSYGHRRAPIGNQARVSSDEGRTWSEPILISADAASGDLGYPSTVELTDGTLLTVWYEKMADAPLAVLRQARWQLNV
ncbi:BNR/Asp-box repeat protein [Maioricimonas rarisocia]|uniref:BNR/Asp-box repeat protein n=1 Tax=Maioricimonas rarisocia TaxID=2528026 RepID=A0A517ZE88_9PLAN|nr:sialidase family protein [Maioricimonas rarisocia]QDU40775.1 BNR/Asp-box repeat protein [Maioricimonas rarisocia]